MSHGITIDCLISISLSRPDLLIFIEVISKCSLNSNSNGIFDIALTLFVKNAETLKILVSDMLKKNNNCRDTRKSLLNLIVSNFGPKYLVS